MRLNLKAYLFGLPMMCVSSWAAALGLGEIKLNSSLNQPLDAEVQLINVRDLTKQEIIIGLAAKADFDRAGVDLTYFLTELKFSVDLGAANGPVVRIKTTEPVKEPFLNFITFAQWPSGKLFREYTVLVDLPVFSGSKSAPVQVATKTATQAKQPVTRSAPKVSQTESVEYAANDTPSNNENSTFDSDVFGPVGSSDTLWSIAAKVRPDSSFSIQQTMLAIQRLNPSAFINNNINLLRKGQVLRVPDAQQIGELSSREAIREVAGQNNTWSSGSTQESEERGAQLEGSKNFAETKTDVEEVEGRVKLSSNTESESETAQGSDEGELGGAQIEKNLDQTQEQLDAEDREKSELESRLSAIDEQIETMEKLVEVSNEELRALELAAQQTTESEAAEIEQTEVVEAVEDSGTEVVAVTDDPVVAVQPVPQAQPQKSIVDLMMDNIIYIIGGVGALLLLIVGFFLLRNKEDDFDSDFDDELDDLSAFEGTDLDEGEQDFGEADLLSTEDDTEVLEQAESEEELETSVEAETEDVVGECDIHLAYGQYDQAEEKLLRALEKEPANALVRLKLMEVLAAQGDAESFDENYAKLLILNDEDISSRAASLREGVINISAYDASKYDTSDFEALVGSSPDSSDVMGEDDTLIANPLEADLAEEGEDETLIAPPPEPEVDDGPSLEDLELGLELGGEPSVADEAVSTEEAVAEDDLSGLLDEPNPEEISIDANLDDFDLGDLELDLDDSDLGDTVSGESDLEDMDLSDDLDFDLEGLDAEPEESEEVLSADFSENLITESKVPPVTDDAMDFSSLDLESDSPDVAESVESDLELDLDLDALDLSDDLSLGDDPVDESESSVELDLDLDESGDLGELGDLAVEDVQAENSSLVGESSESEVDSEKEADFDVSFNLEDNLDLDELDNELDELAAESIGEGELDVSADLDVSEPELASQPDTQELEEAEVESDLGLSGSVDALGDLQAEAANEVEVEPEAADISPTSEFDADSEFEIPDFDPDTDDDSNLDFLSDNDETATKLDLARAYIDMGDADGAKDILDEILEEGNDGQKKDAQGLLKKLA